MKPAIPTIRRQRSTPPAPASPFPYHPGSLLSVLDLTVDGVSRVLVRATELEGENPILRDHILAKRRIALLFYESSVTSGEQSARRDVKNADRSGDMYENKGLHDKMSGQMSDICGN